MELEKNGTIEIYDFIQDLDNEKFNSKLQSALKKIIDEEGYIKYIVRTKYREADGGNYLSKLYEIDVTGETAKGHKETNLFVKLTLTNDRLRGVLHLDQIYLKEILFYTELSHLFKKLQVEAGIPANEMFKSAKCYDESTPEAIIMENLTRKGFKILNRMEVMPLKFVQLSVKQIAKFHALSFVIERKMPVYFEDKIKKLKGSLQINEQFHKFAANVFKTTTNKFSDEVQNKIKRDCSVFVNRYSQFYTPEITSVNCLCHGDFRLNNILAQEINGDITEIVPVDYQLIFYGSPITDLIFHLYMGTDRKFRRDHENDLKDLYYETLKDFLTYFDIELDTLYPRNIFDKDYINVREYGLIIGLLILPYVFFDEKMAPDFEKTDLLEMDMNIDEKYYSWISDIYDEFSYLIN